MEIAMNHCDGVLKMYAEAGMRTLEDWALAGRDVIDGSKSRAESTYHGLVVPLYTRDQTNIHHKKDNRRTL
jgi:hypothetical protein